MTISGELLNHIIIMNRNSRVPDTNGVITGIF